MRGGAAVGGRRLSAPALASFLLHAAAVLCFAAMGSPDRLPAPPPEQGVEIVWQDSPEDSAPGEEAAAPAPTAEPASAEAPPQERPTEPEQELAEIPPPPEARPLETETPEPSPPEPPFPPEAALAEAPPTEEAEPLPPPPAEQPSPTQAVGTPPPEGLRPPDLPPPPPAPPALPRAAPRRQQQQQQQQQQQLALQAAATRQAALGPAAPPDVPGGSKAVGAVSPPAPLEGARNPEPEYPFASRLRGDQGVVRVRLGVSAAGEVTEVEVIATSGHPALDDSARRAVQRWRFRPAMRDGVPVPGSIRTAVHFRLG